MSNLPKYYFGDISADVMQEIMDEMLRLKPEPELAAKAHRDLCRPIVGCTSVSSIRTKTGSYRASQL